MTLICPYCGATGDKLHKHPRNERMMFCEHCCHPCIVDTCDGVTGLRIITTSDRGRLYTGKDVSAFLLFATAVITAKLTVKRGGK